MFDPTINKTRLNRRETEAMGTEVSLQVGRARRERENLDSYTAIFWPACDAMYDGGKIEGKFCCESSEQREGNFCEG